MMNSDRLDELIQKYVQGNLAESEVEELSRHLQQDEAIEARRKLRLALKADAYLEEAAAEMGQEADWNEPVTESKVLSRKPRIWKMVGVAASIAAVITVGFLGWFRQSETLPIRSRLGVARVIRIEGNGTAGKDRIVVDRAELFAGEDLAMQQGTIELAFRETGVHVIATAPLKMKLNNNQHVSLHEGQVKLVVPPQGVGFVVDTDERKFVDLGTSFVVTANSEGSEVLVLDGKISVDEHDGTSEDLMHEGEFAKFGRNGKTQKRASRRVSLALPELSLPATKPSDGSMRGVVLGYGSSSVPTKDTLDEDVIGQGLLPLIQSGFQNRACLEDLKQGKPVSFRGIAGAYHDFPDRTGLSPYSREGGWMAWYHGQVLPPRPGRYRFWGYADNHLLVAINGKPAYEGSRRDSSFKQLGIPRTDNPALPCLIAPAGFACSEWIELSGAPVRLDLLFGEVGGNLTSGLLLIEREGDTYQETFWGQPKWPLFLTEAPGEDEIAEFERLVNHLEERTMGSFSVSEEAVWKVVE